MVVTNLGEVNLTNIISTPYQFSVSGTGSTITLSSQLCKGSAITPPQLSTSTLNFSPTNLAVANVIELTADTSFPSISGLTAQNVGTYVDLVNTGSNSILLSDESTALGQLSTAANRFAFNGYDVPLFPKSIITLMYSGGLSRWIMPHRIAPIIPPSRWGFRVFWEALSGNAENPWTITTASGGSASAVEGTAQHPGVRNFTLGTSTTGSASVMSTSAAQPILLGNSWYWRYDALIKLSALSDGTNRYTLRLGFIDSGTAESTDGVFFRYVDNVNSGKWEIVARSNGSESAADSTVTAQTTNYSLFTIIVNPQGHSAEYFIDNVSKGTRTAQIPTGASRGTGFGWMFLKSLGTADNVAVSIDFMEVIGYANTLRTT